MGEDGALAQLREILARPEYLVDRSVPWWQQLLAPVIDFVWSAAVRVIQMVFDVTTGREGAYGLGVLAACVVLVAVVASYLVRSVRLTVTRESQVHRASLVERRERSERLWLAAQQAADAGQYVEAIRLSYLSVLYALDERALLHVEANLTNREHAQLLLASHTEIGDAFSRLVARYDQLRYGQAPVGVDTFDDFSGRVQQLRTAALGGSLA